MKQHPCKDCILLCNCTSYCEKVHLYAEVSSYIINHNVCPDCGHGIFSLKRHHLTCKLCRHGFNINISRLTIARVKSTDIIYNNSFIADNSITDINECDPKTIFLNVINKQTDLINLISIAKSDIEHYKSCSFPNIETYESEYNKHQLNILNQHLYQLYKIKKFVGITKDI